jgi:hypothetical protein
MRCEGFTGKKHCREVIDAEVETAIPSLESELGNIRQPAHGLKYFVRCSLQTIEPSYFSVVICHEKIPCSLLVA